jgi:hypothetical protein
MTAVMARQDTGLSSIGRPGRRGRRPPQARAQLLSQHLDQGAGAAVLGGPAPLLELVCHPVARVAEAKVVCVPMTLAAATELINQPGWGGVPSPDSHEIQRVAPWPFAGNRFPGFLGAVVMRTVLSGYRPALQVVHFPDGDWGVADGVGDPNEPGACVISHLRHVVERDTSLEGLASLAPGMVAERSAAGEPWVASPFFGSSHRSVGVLRV